MNKSSTQGKDGYLFPVMGRKDMFEYYENISPMSNKLNHRQTSMLNTLCLIFNTSEIYLLGLLTRLIGNLQRDVNVFAQAAARKLRHNAHVTAYCSRKSYD